MAEEWPASTSTLSTITEDSLTMSVWPIQRRRSALGVVVMAQKLLVNGGSDRRDSHAPPGKMKLNPISLNASKILCLFALVRGPVYATPINSPTPCLWGWGSPTCPTPRLALPACHLLCWSINISQLPGWQETIFWVKQRFLRANEGGNRRSAQNSITYAA